MKRTIKKAAVLGSGIMGSRIACHFANIGVEVLLLDIVPRDLDEKQKSNPAARNKLVNDALQTAIKSNPSPLYNKSKASLIQTGNFDDDMSKIKDVDWIIEVVVENLDIKKSLFEKVEKERTEGTLITSNTSGIPIHLMLDGRSEDFQKNFCGTHFFNPPRYLRLLEIIPTPKTDPEIVDFLMNYGDLFLGKETVLCKDAVTVKGPPGTGKSHTIANLIAHFVAQGKSILVVSKNAKALEVIKEKLPTDIRDLAVSFLNDGNQTDELKHSIDAIKNHLGKTYSQQEWESLEESLRELDLQYAQKQEEILEMIRLNSVEISLYDPQYQTERTLSAEEWAKRWRENERPLVLLADAIPEDLNEEDFAQRLMEFSQEWETHDQEVLNYPYSSTDHLPEPLKLENVCGQMELLEQKIDPTKYSSLSPSNLTPDVLNTVKEFQAIWKELTPYLAILQLPNFQAEKFQAFLQAALPDWKDIQEESRQLPTADLDLTPLGATLPEILLHRIQKLIEKFGDKSRLNLLKRQMLSKDEKLFFQCSIDGQPIQTKEELKILEKQWNHAIREKEFHDRMGLFYGSLEILITPSETNSFLIAGEDMLEKHHAYLQLQGQLHRQSIPCPSLSCSDPHSWIDYLTGLEDYRDWGRANEELQRWISETQKEENPHPAWEAIHQALKTKNPAAYQEELDRYQSAIQLAKKAQAVVQLKESLASQMPQTVERLIQNEADAPISKEVILEDFFQVKLKSQLDEICQQFEEGNTLFEELEKLQGEIRETCVQLIATKTWFHKQQEISDEQLAALSAWRNDLVNIGKGPWKKHRSKYRFRRQKHAIGAKHCAHLDHATGYGH